MKVPLNLNLMMADPDNAMEDMDNGAQPAPLSVAEQRRLLELVEREEERRKRKRPDEDDAGKDSKRGRGRLNEREEQLYKKGRNSMAKAAQFEVDHQHLKKYRAMEGHFIPSNLQVSQRNFLNILH